MFAEGRAALPAGGMGQIPRQLAGLVRAGGGEIRTGSPVASVNERTVTLAGGQTLRGRAIVVATELPAAERLLGRLAGNSGPERSACTVYFAAERPPIGSPTLVLNGQGEDRGNSSGEEAGAGP